MKHYKAIFFDLDHTLWDYEKNSCETLNELYIKYELYSLGGFSFESFIKRFDIVNTGLWNRYNQGAIDKEIIRTERFHRIFDYFKVADRELSIKISEDYLVECPTKINLFPFTHEVLKYLGRRYPLYILTNGFDDVQKVKIDRCKLTPYFQGMITSETIGHKKPHPKIFDHALEVAQILNHEGIMVGDNLKADILGAKNASIDSIYFNPTQKRHSEDIDTEITCLSELMKIL